LRRRNTWDRLLHFRLLLKATQAASYIGVLSFNIQ
jgi:hypothetical protein